MVDKGRIVWWNSPQGLVGKETAKEGKESRPALGTLGLSSCRFSGDSWAVIGTGSPG